MMAVTTLTGERRITDLAKELEHRFQLSPTNIEKIMMAKETLAVLHRPSTSKPTQFGVPTWTLNVRTPLRFAASLHRSLEQALRPCDLEIVLDCSKVFLVICERVTEAKAIYSTRFSLEGQVHAEGALDLSNAEIHARHSEKAHPLMPIDGQPSGPTRQSGNGNLSRLLARCMVHGVQYKQSRDDLRCKEY